MTSGDRPAVAQTPAADQTAIDELVLINRMLASREKGGLGAYGHVSVRNRRDQYSLRKLSLVGRGRRANSGQIDWPAESGGHAAFVKILERCHQRCDPGFKRERMQADEHLSGSEVNMNSEPILRSAGGWSSPPSQS